MKCLILCAGYATRLYPLTLDMPKPLMPIAGKPILEHILKKIEELDAIDEIFIVTNSKFFDNFRNWKRGYSGAKPIKILNDRTKTEYDRLGAIGDIDFALKEEKISGEIMVVAGDNLFDFSLRHLHGFFREKTASVIALYDIRQKSLAAGKYGIVEVDESGKVIGFEEKPESPKTTLVSTACYIFSETDIKELERCIAENNKPDNLGDFINWISKRKPIYGYAFSGRWFDIGNKEQLMEADKEWSRKII